MILNDPGGGNVQSVLYCRSVSLSGLDAVKTRAYLQSCIANLEPV